jgi:hypothetical protein
MPVPPTEDNPHGWGHVEKREILSHYQLSPRIQIVVGDEIKISKGPYWVNKDGVKVSMDKMKGKWQVTGIFENFFGNIEMDVVHCWPGGLFGSTTTIAITGDEHTSPIVDTIIRRPFKVRLAASKYKKRAKKHKEEKTNMNALADIVRRASV